MKHCIHREGNVVMCCWCGYQFVLRRPDYLPIEDLPDVEGHGQMLFDNLIATGGDEECVVRNDVQRIRATMPVMDPF